MGIPTKRNGEVEIDLGRYELRRFGRRVKLEKKPMELLIFLVGRREQLVTREEIVRKLWRSDLFIDTERNVNNIVRKIRAALGDNSTQPRFLETAIGKGYRFIGPVRVIDAKFSRSVLEPSSGRAVGQDDRGERWDRSSLAVLPPVLLGKATDDNGLCLGLADALVTRLGNLQGLNVLPTSAVLNVPLNVTASEAASRLGVRFVVHGAVQMSKGQWRLSMEMFDVYLQKATFAKKCDLDTNLLSEIESDIARQIAGALNRPVGPAVIERRPRYSKDPMAYAEFMRGYGLRSPADAEQLDKAMEHLLNAVTRDPAFSLAHAALSLACATRHFEFDPVRAWLEKAEFHCRRALEIDPDTFPRATLRPLSCFGGHRKISSTLMRSPPLSARSRCRTICPMPTTV